MIKVPVIIKKAPQSPRSNEKGTREDHRSGRKSSEKLLLVFNGLLTLFTFLLVIVGWKQGRATQDAADAAAAGARHTQQALEHTRLAERAWVAVRQSETRGFDKLQELRRRWPAEHWDIPSLNVCLRFENGGKTVARITRFVTKLDIEKPEGLPPEPDYGTPTPHPPLLLPPGLKEEVWGDGLFILDPEDLAGLFRGERGIACYGLMAYRIVGDRETDPPRESRFCFVGRFQKDGTLQLNVGGPPAYNLYT